MARKCFIRYPLTISVQLARGVNGGEGFLFPPNVDRHGHRVANSAIVWVIFISFDFFFLKMAAS